MSVSKTGKIKIKKTRIRFIAGTILQYSFQAILSETVNIDENVAVERLTIIPGKASCPNDCFGVVTIDVNDRNTNRFGHIAAIARRAGTFGWCGISNLSPTMKCVCFKLNFRDSTKKKLPDC